MCGNEFGNKVRWVKHLLKKKCQEGEKILAEAIREIEEKIQQDYYIECQLCGFVGKSLASHFRKHDMLPKDYKDKFGANMMTNEARENCNWIKKAKDEGRDLTEHFKNLGKSISKTIMNNPKDRQRRSKMMGGLNKTDVFRKKASETAKITSARKDIQQQRAERLKSWRDENPEEFYEKCTKKMINSRKEGSPRSKPEGVLLKILNENCQDRFLRNTRVSSIKIFKTNKTHTKECDLISKDEGIIIEFDGKHHFKAIYGEERFEKTLLVDRELEEYCKQKEILLIRVDYSQFLWRRNNKDRFRDGVIIKIIKIIDENKKGIFRIGEYYAENQIS